MKIDKNIEILIVSAGGVGTTFLMNFIMEFKSINHRYDYDDLKHNSLPPISKNKNLKIIYVFGNPIDATISLFRRNFQSTQSIKLNKNYIFKNHIKAETKLSDYSKSQIDCFHFENHFNNYYEKFLVYDTLFLKYEKIHENIEEILDFCEIERKSIKKFPKRKKRFSDSTKIDITVLENLKKLYGKIENDFENMPDTRIKKAKFSRFKLFYSFEYIIVYLLNVKRNIFLRHLFKSFSWRIIGTLDTVLISWLISNDLTVSLKIGFFEIFTKIILYVLHEHIWFNYKINNAKIRHIFKTFTWRLIATSDTIILGWILSGNISVGISIGLFEIITKMILYYLHERTWYIFDFGLDKSIRKK